MSPEQFSALYWGAQPIPVQALSGMERLTDERAAKAWDLVKQGFVIDPDIGLRGGDPYWTMFNRINQGFTWYWGLGHQASNLVLPPGLSYPGLVTYDPDKPAEGSVKVSLNPDDYPPVIPPPPPPPPAESVPAEPFWQRRTGSFCEAHPLDHSEDGAVWEDKVGHKGTWVKTVLRTPFGTRQYWEKVS